MVELASFFDVVQTGGFVGLLIILAFPNLREKFGFTKQNGKEVDMDALAMALNKALVEDDHSPILVKGRIKRICDDITAMKNDIALIKKVIVEGKKI